VGGKLPHIGTIIWAFVNPTKEHGDNPTKAEREHTVVHVNICLECQEFACGAGCQSRPKFGGWGWGGGGHVL
jgi:hypothetical protein